MRRYNFNLDWEFKKCGTEKWKPVTLPHDAMLTEERDPDCKNGHNTGFYPGGRYEYKKYFTIDQSNDGKVILEFEGIYRNSEVFVNGVKAGSHHYGYTNFYIDITGYLNFGKQNEILVTVDNSEEPNSRWYTGSGIYRSVNLYMGRSSYINPNGVRITSETEDVEIEVQYQSDKVCTIKTDILFEGQFVQSETSQDASLKLHIANAKKWSVESPKLYVCSVSLMEDGEVVDTHEEEFGIRKIMCDANSGLRINGEEIKLRGACVHHDNGILGAATYPDAEERRVKILKEAGFNAIRSAHNPISKAMLAACDRLGMYVMDETFDQWYIHKTKYDYASYFESEWEKDTIAMVAKDYNHPSVIMYSVGNEVSETAQERGIELTELQVKKVREFDVTRPVTCGINLFLNGLVRMGKGIYKEEDKDNKPEKGKKSKREKKQKASGSEFVNIFMSFMGSFMNNFGRLPFVDKATRDAFEKLDICGYNYGYGRYRMEKRTHPERVIVGSETFPPDLARNWRLVEKLPYLIGDFMWTGFDYLGEAGLGSFTYPEQTSGMRKPYPWLLAECGVIDITGLQTAQARYNQVVWGFIDYPVIAVQPVHRYPDKPMTSMWRGTNAVESWAWDNCEGKKAVVEVYSTAPQVELLLNSRSVGVKKAGDSADYKAVFNGISYESGTLTAIAKDRDGKELSRSELKSAQKEVYLWADMENTKMRANGQDLAYINIAFADKDGIVKVLEDKEIEVLVEGPGTLVGFGSANPYTEEGFLINKHTPYFGRTQAIVRAGTTPGTVLVKISAQGCEDMILEIDTYIEK